MILRLGEGTSSAAVAREMKTRPARVSKWRRRFALERLRGLSDAPRSGKPTRYDSRTERRILKALGDPPPKGSGAWTGTLLARRLGDVSADQVWRVLRLRRIHLQRRRSWCVSTDPEFARKAADVAGLYLDPPENALVLCVEEKPHIPAPDRAEGWLRLPNGKALPATVTTTRAAARARSSPPWKRRPAWSKPGISSAAGGGSSCTS